MAEEDYEHCMFADLRDNLTICRVVDHLLIVTSGRIRPLTRIFERCKRSKQPIYHSQNDFLTVLPAQHSIFVITAYRVPRTAQPARNIAAPL